MPFAEDDVKRFLFNARGEYFNHQPKCDEESAAFDAGFDAALQAIDPYLNMMDNEIQMLKRLRKLERKAKKLQRKIQNIKSSLPYC